MGRGTQRSRKPGVTHRALGAVFMLAASAVSAGCGAVGQSPEVPVAYQDPEVGAARLMADSTLRVRGVVNVTRAYPDPRNEVVGAAVLIDDRIGIDLPRTDFRQRPVFVVYVSKSAAMKAADGRPAGTQLRNGSRVIFLPIDFPRGARAAYEEGLGAALQ